MRESYGNNIKDDQGLCSVEKDFHIKGRLPMMKVNAQLMSDVKIQPLIRYPKIVQDKKEREKERKTHLI